jgi:ribosomal protein S4
MAFQCDRKNETLEWFLFREKIYGSRDEALQAIKDGTVIVNGKAKKDPEYKPKKKDEFGVKGYITFTVEE